MTTKKTTTKKTTVKKASPKKATKKVVSKKAVTKTGTQLKKVVIAKGSDCFWINNGPILKDLMELEKALQNMTGKVFAHHVSNKRNDFADWIEFVLKDSETATAFRKTKKPKTARSVLVKQLKFYQSPNKK